MRTKIVRFAAFVALTGVLTLWIGQNITGGRHGPRYTLTATFDDVAGMFEGDDVRLAGISVGEVTGIDVVDGRAEVDFAVDRSLELPEDSVVSVRWLNLIGQRFLGIVPGTSTRVLSDGDVMDRAENVVDLGQLVNQLVPLTRSVRPDQVNTILTTLLAAFDGNDESFDALIGDMRSVLGVLADKKVAIDQLLVDYDTIVGAVASRDAQIGQMVDNLVAISETFAANDALLDDAFVKLAGLSDGLDRLLDAGADDLGASIDNLAALLSIAAADVDRLESGLQNLPGLFEDILPALNRGEWLRVSVLCVTQSPGPCPYPTGSSSGGGEGPLVIDPGGVLGDLTDLLGVAG